ncbi:hypothetical protein B5F39_13820 [Cloacibacillus sp. An23]|nr:hypothetical protein B5F39_13820 [Cloacibacillus sp. An23]
MASIVARALVTVDAEKASKQDMELLKKLVMEFKDELDALGVKVDSLDKRVAVLEDRLGGWKVNGQFWFDARFASNDDSDHNSYGFTGNGANDENQFGFAYARMMVTKYIDDNTFFFFRARFNDGSGDLDNWFMDRFYVRTKLPWDITFTVGRQYSDWEGDAELYRALVGDNEGGVWKDQKYDGFNFQKSFGMLDAELLIGRNDNMISDKYSYYDGTFTNGDPDSVANDNAFMEYGLRLQANFSENFYLGLMGLYFDADEVDLSDAVEQNGQLGKYIVGDALDLQQYGAYLSYSFTPSVALRGYYYFQDLDDGWIGAATEDSPQTWSVLLDLKQDLLKFTSLWVQYIEQDNTWVGPRASTQYPAIFTPGEAYPITGDGTNKTFMVNAYQQWGESKWSSFIQYMTTDWDQSGWDDTDQYTIGIGYQYTPQIKFWLAYNYIDYGDKAFQNSGQKYDGGESVILFRTAIDF